MAIEGKITPLYLEEEMKTSYLNYAMSVIVGRALPDVRDGLKPVQRRILYAMRDLGLVHNKPHKKSARITGETLGKYHPHGDTAVYDAMVRMAQKFSLRYPLIDGQGNFGCFTKDTKVKLTDGRNLTFEELIKESEKGKRNYTFTFNPCTKRIEIAEIKNPRLTIPKAEIIKVTLNNGEEIKCTLNHKFMLRDGTYREAKDLRIGDSLMPLYTRLYDGEKDENLKGYEIVYQPMKDNWDFVHHLADELNLRKGVYERSAGRIRHHLDFNKLNNNPDNIQRILWKDHWKLHKEIASWRHKNDPSYVKKLAKGRENYWSNPENREKASNLRKEINKENWQDPVYRRKMSEIIKKAWQNPKYRKRIIESASKNLKRLWERKDFQELLSNLKSKELKKRWKDENYRKAMSELTRKVSLKIWADPNHREKISKLMKEKWQNPEYYEKQRKIAKELWQDPEYRAKYSSDHFSKMAKKLWKDPKVREFHQKKAIKQWQNLEFREKFIAGVIAANKHRLEKNPNFMKELTQKAKIY